MLNINQKEDLKNCLENFCINPYGFILLSGRNGTGKSFSARAVYDRLARFKLPAYDHDDALFITQVELNLQWSKQMQSNGDCLYLLDQLSNTKLLVLDDVGTRTPSEAFMDFLYAISDARFKNKDKVGTIITTNLTSSSMREKFGDAFVSRVASGCCFRLEGEDRRFNTLKTNFKDLEAIKMCMPMTR